MKNIFRILFLIVLFFSFSTVLASSIKTINTGSIKDFNNSEKPKIKTEDSSKDESELEDKKSEEDKKSKLLKELNSIYIEWYKVKFSNYLNEMEDNMKLKSKEYKIKVFTNIIINVDTKISLIKEGKIEVSKNRKEILLWILWFIKDYSKIKIEEISKEK